MERKAWLRGVWEMVKEAFCQKLFTCHLPSSPHLLPDQFSSHSVIVTGATSGIGLHTAREVAMCGAHVTLACRNTKAAREIAHRWQQEAHASRVLHVEVMELDLLSLSSVRSFAAEWERRARPLHVLINNAGVFLMGEPQKFSDDGIEQHLQVNHVAPALLTLLLLPSLLRAPSSRIINVNSVLMFLKILASKLMDERKNCIQCIAVHPGIVTTNLVRTVPSFRRRSFWRFDPKEGARSVLFCVASADVAADLEKGFAYYSCNCKPARVSAQAADVDTCMEVWQKTLEIAGLNADYLTQVMDNASNPTLIYRELLGNTSIIV
ncbi:dehydrogenase/reductase SDR family member FEY-like isoform X2 [Magnolia sinica]|uniref:dehydrogenase/reductase SDR family member FEY-like isoform X2 n=1 Tax=Magnolia sinica TaxID=86752 RepID=UPI00265A0020|nr:dehydrogenase/reductase SDR family member FEY-like isoform X2 [Magnolia sinica]